MSILARKDSCIGLTLFKWGQRKLELWFAPSDYECKEHVHPNSDGEFFVIFSRGRKIWKTKPYLRGRRVRITGPDSYEAIPVRIEYNTSERPYWHTLTVRHNEPHGFSKGTTPMIWLCWETWKPGVKPTSVAYDFALTKV